MNKAVKFSSGLLLTLLYCFALYSATQPLPETFSYHSEHQENISKVSKSLFSLSSIPENVVLSVHAPSGHFLKIPLFNVVGHSKISKQLTAAKISQYANYQTNTLVNFRKNDSIFPFHYFW